MEEKETIRKIDVSHNPNCEVHSGMVTEIDQLKERSKKHEDFLETLQTSKSSSGQMRWVIGIFLVLSMAVVGFLWHGQNALETRIITKLDSQDKETAAERKDLAKMLMELKIETAEIRFKVNEHLRQWPAPDKKY